MTDLITTDVWALARAAYLAGDTAAAVCARFRIGRSAFYEAARSGGWRRSDTLAGAADAPAPPGEALPCVDLAEVAMARASDAVMGGRLHEAQGWTRLAGELRRLAVEESGRAGWREALGAAIDADCDGRAAAGRLEALERPDSPDSVDSARTPDIALTHSTTRRIGAEPDFSDSPALAGLLADWPALPSRRSCSEIARLRPDRRRERVVADGP